MFVKKHMDFNIFDYLHEISHAFIDTLIVFIVVLIIYFILSFFENKLASKINHSNKFSPIIGAGVGLIPQCGFSIVAADMYRKNYITLGTLLAVFISTSDEAIPILLASPNKILSILPLITIKFIIAIFFGYLVDFIYKKKILNVDDHKTNTIHKGCCNHHIEHDKKDTFIKTHIIHPLLHSLKICAYVLVINIVFSSIIYFIGENTIMNFLNKNVLLTPLLSSLIGLIPNCASSVIITQLYVSNTLTFSATISGLICNAGLGLIYLFKDKNKITNSLLIMLLLLSISLLVGYVSLFIELSI